MKKKHVRINGIAYTIEYGLNRTNGKPYFTAHGEGRIILESGRRSRTVIVCGRLDEVTEQVLGKDFVEFLLRDIDGEPLHPVANGMYFLGYTSGGENHYAYNKDAVVNHFLIDGDFADEIKETLEDMKPEYRKPFIEGVVEGLKREWKQRADSLRRKYNI